MLDLLREPYRITFNCSSRVRSSTRATPPGSTAHCCARFSTTGCAAPRQRHLDHYAERLEIMLPAEEFDLAREFSPSPAGRGGMQHRPAPNDDRDLLRAVLRLLDEDGYVTVEGNTVRFRSNLLREYWRRIQMGPCMRQRLYNPAT